MTAQQQLPMIKAKAIKNGVETEIEVPLGSIFNFDHRPFLAAANWLCISDEFERALQLLDNLPAFYRDYPPQEIVDMRAKILDLFMTSRDYMLNSHDEVVLDEEGARVRVQSFHRGITIKELVEYYNKQGYEPHIIDLGPGEYWLSLGLKALGLKFKYQPFSIHPKAEAVAAAKLGDHFTKSNPDGSAPIIFNACEIIEHLHWTGELSQYYHRAGGYADHIVITTPYYTYGGGNFTWYEDKNRGLLGHLRAFTPSEFVNEVTKLFPGYNWQVTQSEVVQMTGTHHRVAEMKNA